jgi:hypothetical protein
MADDNADDDALRCALSQLAGTAPASLLTAEVMAARARRRVRCEAVAVVLCALAGATVLCGMLLQRRSRPARLVCPRDR